MIRWVVVIFLALAIFPFLIPVLQKLGFWRIPGDVRFKLFGQIFCLPFGSTVLLSALVFLVAKLLQ
ncbi:MAG TPA: DUF2905 domain-containing protein [Burkholderiaceae bacterium]|jgi:hypothetical protein|nr:DUF2905 domain-containing protein [Burkholderiaceae bacterium]